MRSVIFMGAVVLSASVLSAELTPLSVKTGLWEVTMTSTVMGTPHPRTYKSCLKKEDLNKYPFGDTEHKCTYTVVKSTGATMEAHGTCTPPDGRVDFDLKLDVVDAENIKGTGKMTISAAGTTMDGAYAGSAKWMGATCPAGIK